MGQKVEQASYIVFTVFQTPQYTNCSVSLVKILLHTT